MEAEKDKTKDVEVQEEIQKCRMTLRGRDVKALEECCKNIVKRAKDSSYMVKGPVRVPTKKLCITTRRSPCGNGTNTWDRFEMRIHKRYFDIFCPSSAIKHVTDFRIDPSVDVCMVINKD